MLGRLFLLFEVVCVDSIADNSYKSECYEVSKHFFDGDRGNGDIWLRTNHH